MGLMGLTPTRVAQWQSSPLFPATPANPNKIKGHGNPVPDQCDLLSQRKKGDFSDSYVIF
jgi:hypothetical protein